MSGHGGGGIVAIIAIVVFVVALIVAFMLFPKSAKNQFQFGTGSATSTSGGLPLAGVPRPSAGKTTSPGASTGNVQAPITRSSSTFFTQGTTPQPSIKPKTITPYATSTPSAATSSQPVIRDSEIPAGFTRSQLSPYFRQVRLGALRAARFGSPGQASL